MRDFPIVDLIEGTRAPFWLVEEVIRSTVHNEARTPILVVDDNVLTHLPLVIVQAYWDPRSMKPRSHRIRQQSLYLIRLENMSKRDRDCLTIVL